MNRSLLEFRRAKSGITVVPNPVFPQEMRDPLWFIKPRILVILGNEYHKYLVASLRADLWSMGGLVQGGIAGLRALIQAELGSVQGWFARLLHHG